MLYNWKILDMGLFNLIILFFINFGFIKGEDYVIKVEE